MPLFRDFRLDIDGAEAVPHGHSPKQGVTPWIIYENGGSVERIQLPYHLMTPAITTDSPSGLVLSVNTSDNYHTLLTLHLQEDHTAILEFGMGCPTGYEDIGVEYGKTYLCDSFIFGANYIYKASAGDYAWQTDGHGRIEPPEASPMYAYDSDSGESEQIGTCYTGDLVVTGIHSVPVVEFLWDSYSPKH